LGFDLDSGISKYFISLLDETYIYIDSIEMYKNLEIRKNLSLIHD